MANAPTETADKFTWNEGDIEIVKLGSGKKYWLFQCNPKRYDLAAFLEGGGTHEDWAMNQGRTLVSPGDRVFFWQTGADAQLLAVGQVISPVYERESSDFGRYCVDIAFEHKIVPPLRKDEVLENETLRNFAPF